MKSPLIARQRSRRSPRRDVVMVVVVVVVRPTCAVPLAVFPKSKRGRTVSFLGIRGAPARPDIVSRSFPTVALVSPFPLPSPSVSVSLVFPHPAEYITIRGTNSPPQARPRAAAAVYCLRCTFHAPAHTTHTITYHCALAVTLCC